MNYNYYYYYYLDYVEYLLYYYYYYYYMLLMYVIIITNYKKDNLFSNCVIERMCYERKMSCMVGCLYVLLQPVL